MKIRRSSLSRGAGFTQASTHAPVPTVRKVNGARKSGQPPCAGTEIRALLSVTGLIPLQDDPLVKPWLKNIQLFRPDSEGKHGQADDYQ